MRHFAAIPLFLFVERRGSGGIAAAAPPEINGRPRLYAYGHAGATFLIFQWLVAFVITSFHWYIYTITTIENCGASIPRGRTMGGCFAPKNNLPTMNQCGSLGVLDYTAVYALGAASPR